MIYDHKAIEKKWQQFWIENKTFKADIDESKEKYYALDMFPYPSGAGLHVGHPEGYTATDIISRYKRMKGFNVLHCMGWDAFGLPAEQYALKTGTHPKLTTQKNIDNFRRQIKALGFSYDWDREVNTTDPKYYKWTQWIFLKLFNKGLAYQDNALVNWCPALKTVLSNEEVIDGKSAIGSHPVERRTMKQWMLRITEYADVLLQDLDELDWSDSLKDMQRNWIGKSFGARIRFDVVNSKESFNVFTTRSDTLFGATYCVLAPENPIVDLITTKEQKEQVQAYKDECKRKSEKDRLDLSREKTGVFLGSYAMNPVNQKQMPIWIADYVLASYAEGAIMAVPAHDERDFEFATKFKLPILSVIEGQDAKDEVYVGEGLLANSEFLNGLTKQEAIDKMLVWLEETGNGEKTINYKLRDWLFSRQRYWGEPFPLYIEADGSITPMKEEELPLTLPEVESYQPSGTGASPLATIKEWVDQVLPDGRKVARETNTMPQWAGSCWYYLRYLDPDNEQEIFSKKAESYWMPVDLYIGGAEHAVLHLLYARFWHKVLYDLGYVSTKEPFKKLVNQGMILGEDHQKMSKSLGNVINPDEIIEQYGADTLRLYEMFMGPLEKSKPWNNQGLDGIYRFLTRVWRLFFNVQGEALELSTQDPSEETLSLLHSTIKKVTTDIEALHFNTAISQMMILSNHLASLESKNKDVLTQFILLLAPFAPHMAEELWAYLGNNDTLSYAPFPTYEEKYIKQDTVILPLQINGKVRDQIEVAIDVDKETVLALAKKQEKLQKYLDGFEIKKIIFVPQKIVNFVVKPK